MVTYMLVSLENLPMFYKKEDYGVEKNTKQCICFFLETNWSELHRKCRDLVVPIISKFIRDGYSSRFLLC